MVEFLFGMDFELRRDVHVLRATEYLGINNLGDDRLILAGQVFIQEFRELVTGNFVFV